MEPFVRVSAAGGRVTLRGSAHARLAGSPSVDAPHPGPYAEWRYAEGRLTAGGGPLGFYPLYYCANDTTIALSPSIPTLLAQGAPTALDDDALAAFLRLGFFVGEDTPFAAIRALPPGATLAWEPGRFRLATRLPAPAARPQSRAHAVAGFQERFREAIRRRLPGTGTVGLPLSGGRDSRHILFELVAQGRRPDLCVTATYHPPRANNDLPVARELAAALRLPHATVEQPRSAFEVQRRHALATNLCTLTPSHFAHAVGDYLAPRVDVVFDGIGGDVLAAGQYLRAELIDLVRRGRLTDAADRLLDAFQGCSEDLLRLTLAPSVVARFSRERARERVARELRRHAEGDNPVRSFLFFNRTRRDIALMPFRCYAGVGRVECPYLDVDVVTFLLSLPDESVVDHTLHDEAIATAYPQWRHLRYVSRRPDRHDPAHYRRLALALLAHGTAVRPGIARAAVLPRLARCLVDSAYSRTAAWLAPLLVYWSQVRLLAGG